MSKTALAILGLLAEQPMHGYEIKHTVKDRWMDMWAFISLPSIYNTLNRLAGKNYIIEHKEKIGKTPERNVYSISTKGRKYLIQLINKGLNSQKSSDLPFWLAVAFIQQADSKTALKALRNRIGFLEQSCILLEKQRQHYEGKIPFNWYVLMVCGLDHMQLEIKHINLIIESKNQSEL